MNIDTAAVQFIAAAEGASAAVAASSSSSSTAAATAAAATTVISRLSGTAPPHVEGLVGAADDAPDVATMFPIFLQMPSSFLQ